MSALHDIKVIAVQEMKHARKKKIEFFKERKEIRTKTVIILSILCHPDRVYFELK